MLEMALKLKPFSRGHRGLYTSWMFQRRIYIVKRSDFGPLSISTIGVRFMKYTVELVQELRVAWHTRYFNNHAYVCKTKIYARTLLAQASDHIQVSAYNFLKGDGNWNILFLGTICILLKNPLAIFSILIEGVRNAKGANFTRQLYLILDNRDLRNKAKLPVLSRRWIWVFCTALMSNLKSEKHSRYILNK